MSPYSPSLRVTDGCVDGTRIAQALPTAAPLRVISQDDADVVLASVGICSCDQCLACRLDIRVRCQNQFSDVMVFDHISQPIRAKQQIVLGLPGGAEYVCDGFSAAEAAGDLMA